MNVQASPRVPAPPKLYPSRPQNRRFPAFGHLGTDAFSKLKEKYGFASVADWHTVADYRGPFRYDTGEARGQPWTELDPPDWLFEEGLIAQMRQRASGL